MGLRGYIAKRMVYSVILLLGVMTVNFIIFNMMPGDPLLNYILQLEGRITREEILTLKKVYGLDKSLMERYVLYMTNTLSWNLGRSRETKIPIGTEILDRMGNTLLLTGTAAFFSILGGTLLGTFLGYKRGTKGETVTVTTVMTVSGLPVFWIGWIILYFFSIQLGWFQISGTYPYSWIGNWPTNPFQYVAGRLYCLTLPVLTLFILNIDSWTLLTRACIIESITEDYVVTARAKGLKENKVLLKHVLKPASLPLITMTALVMAGLWGGAIITETLFGYEGMGRWIWRAITQTDLPALYAVFFISGMLIIIANFMVDLVYGLVDPRVKVGR